MPCSDAPELSIIIVNWRTRDMTLECIRSVYAETRQVSFEIILVDNGSDDGSAEAIAREFPGVILLAEAKNHGFAIANNIAAKLARGRRLLLLNSDTVVLENAIDILWEFAEARPSAGIWGGRTVFADRSLNIGSCWGAQTLWSVLSFAMGLTRMFPRSNFFNPEGMTGWKRDTVREVDIVSGCFLLIDTHWWNRLEGFAPEFFMYGEEADLCARARAMGIRPIITPEATIIHYGAASAVVLSDMYVRLFKGKIALARRTLAPFSATAVRHLYLLAVVLRVALYGLAARLSQRFAWNANVWHETLVRRREWYSPFHTT